ncbi:MAG: hypothetical protein BGP01_10030 [Paludibacter sp. 47-17]|nr:MAG: hypothetical protein BGP01_10030 [Paludibacter sp. 47-17]
MENLKLLSFRLTVCVVFLLNTVFLFSDPVITNGILISWDDAPEHVIIPSEVVTIAENAFKGNSTLRFLEVTNAVKEIKDKAFIDCVNLDSVYFNFDSNFYTLAPPKVSCNAFINCKKLNTVFIDYSFYRSGQDGYSPFPYLTDLKFGKNLKTIESALFNKCYQLKHIVLPDNIEIIGNNSFSNCIQLDSIVMPGVKILHDGCFENCTALRTITFPERLSTLGRWVFKGCTQLQEIKFNEGLTVISEELFKNCSSIVYVELPHGLNTIGPYSFENCTSLRSVKWSPCLEIIDRGAFRSCDKLEIPDFPVTLKKIGDHAFEKLIKPSGNLFIPDSVTEIGKYAFFRCTSLKQVIIGTSEGEGSTIMLDESPFLGCDSLTRIIVNKPYTNIRRAFYGLKNLKNIYFAENSLTISPSMFENCGQLSTVNIPDSVNSIGSYAFKNCTSLPVIHIPGTVKVIDEGAFQNCSSIVSINLPSELREITQSAFQGCSSLREITIPPYVQLISTYAFQGCTALQKITLPSLVDIIASKAFGSCLNLQEIYCSTKRVPITALNCFDSVPAISCKIYVPSPSITSYKQAEGWQQFGLVEGFHFDIDTTLIIPDEPLYTDLNFPEPVIHVTTVAGELSGQIKNSYYDSVVKLKVSGTMDAKDFSFIRNYLENLVYLDLSEVSILAHDSPNYGVNAANAIPKEAFKYSRLNIIVFPPSILTIGESAFSGCQSLRQPLKIPSTVKTIEKGAFFACQNLKGVLTLPENVETIGESAFRACGGITRLVFKSSLKAIPARAFEKCTHLMIVELPSGVQQIGDNAFGFCPLLFRVSMPSVRSIGNYTFENAELLNPVILPSTLTSIGEYAFSGCKSITEIVFPGLITQLNNFTLKNCIALEKVTLPASLTRLGYGVFTNCTLIKSFYCLAGTPPGSTIDFAQFNQLNLELCTLYVPWGTSDQYKSAPVWNVFKNVEELVKVANESLLVPSVNIFPNPAKDYIVVSGIDEATLLKIFSLGGVELYCKLVSPNEMVSIEWLESGTYLVQLGNRDSRKMSIVR